MRTVFFLALAEVAMSIALDVQGGAKSASIAFSGDKAQFGLGYVGDRYL